jgi:hypothetical protein
MVAVTPPVRGPRGKRDDPEYRRELGRNAARARNSIENHIAFLMEHAAELAPVHVRMLRQVIRGATRQGPKPPWTQA